MVIVRLLILSSWLLVDGSLSILNTNPLSSNDFLLLKPTTVLFMIQFVVDPLPLQKKVAVVPSGTACDSGGTRISVAGRKKIVG